MSIPGGFSNSNIKPMHAVLEAEDTTTACEDLVVAAAGIAWQSGFTHRLTFSGAVLTGYKTATYIQITGATNPLMNGHFAIKTVSGQTIDFINPLSGDNATDESGPGTIAVVIPEGCDRHLKEKGTPLCNAKGDIMAMQYAGHLSGVVRNFYYDVNSEQNTMIAIVNNSAVAGLTHTIKWSLDGINWSDFTTAISGTVNANESDNIIMTYAPKGMKLKIEITCPSSSASMTFYVIAK